jgi:hypothetical protein
MARPHALISYSRYRAAVIAYRIGVPTDWLVLMAASV